MIWSLIFIVSMSGDKFTYVGQYPSYETCHQEADWQVKNSQYFDQWACVQITPAEKAKLKPFEKK